MLALCRLLALAFVAASLAAWPALAQSPKATLNANTASSFPNENTGAITPATTRNYLTTLIASFQQYAGVNSQVGTTYTIAASDYGQLVTFSNTSAIAVALPAASGTFATFNVYISNLNTGLVTITPVSGTINGAASFTVSSNQSAWIVSDGTNYQVFKGFGAGSVNSGTAGQLTWYATSGTTVSGNANANISAGALTLGVASTTQGQLILDGSTSGALTITTQAAAGTPTWTAGTSSGTPAVTASAPLALSTTTGNISITGAAGQVLAGATPAFTATPMLGLNGTTTGQLLLANGGASGASVTLQNLGATSAYNFNLPTTAGSSGQMLQSGGGGATSNTWSTATFPAAAGGAGTILRSDGTNWVTSLTTWPNALTSGGVLYASSATAVSASSAGGANAFMTWGGAATAPNSVAITGLVKGNGASAPAAYAGTSCTNQFPRSLDLNGAATCASVANTDLTNSSVTYGSTTVALGASSTSIAGLTSLGLTSGSTINWNSDSYLGRAAAANVMLGQTNAASPVAQTLSVQNATGTNTAAAATFTIIGPLSTGTATDGDIVFQTGVKTISGSTGATPTTALTIKGETQNINLSANLQLPNAGSIIPASNSTTAVYIANAANSSKIVTVDTSNLRVGINKTPGAYDLDTNGALNVGTTLTFTTLSATSLGASTSTITGLTANNSPNSSNDYLLYYSAGDGAIRKATISAITSAGIAGVSSLNGLTGGLSIVASPANGLSSAASGSSVTLYNNGAYGGGINKFRNGAMDTWQRGTSALATSSGGTYTADGWIVIQTTAQGTCAQATGTNGALYALQCVGATSNTANKIKQRIESYVAAPLASQTVTVQFQYKQDTGGAITPKVSTCFASAQDNFGTCTADVSATSLTSCATATWCTEAYTFTPSASASNGYEITFDCNTALTSSQHCSITAADVRVTPGVTAGVSTSPSPPELRPIMIELSANQRYFETILTEANRGFTGQAISTSAMHSWLTYKKTKRATPSFTTSGSFGANTATDSCTSGTITFTQPDTGGTGVDISSVSGSPLVAGNASAICNGGTIYVSAEL